MELHVSFSVPGIPQRNTIKEAGWQAAVAVLAGCCGCSGMLLLLADCGGWLAGCYGWLAGTLLWIAGRLLWLFW
jgi:hypothetical protein